MSYDPTKPVNGAVVTSAELRTQFQGLKTIIDTQAAQIAALQAQLSALQDAFNDAIRNTARNPNGQFVNFDPNWQPSGDTTTDCIYLRDRLTDLYNIEAR